MSGLAHFDLKARGKHGVSSRSVDRFRTQRWHLAFNVLGLLCLEAADKAWSEQKICGVSHKVRGGWHLAFGVLGLLDVKGGWRAPASMFTLQGVLGCPARPWALIEACTRRWDDSASDSNGESACHCQHSPAAVLESLSSNQRLHRCPPHASLSIHPGKLRGTAVALQTAGRVWEGLATGGRASPYKQGSRLTCPYSNILTGNH